MSGYYKPSGPPEPTRLYDPSGKDITEKVRKAHGKKKKNREPVNNPNEK